MSSLECLGGGERRRGLMGAFRAADVVLVHVLAVAVVIRGALVLAAGRVSHLSLDRTGGHTRHEVALCEEEDERGGDRDQD
jgi:hypothetical protein